MTPPMPPATTPGIDTVSPLAAVVPPGVDGCSVPERSGVLEGPGDALVVLVCGAVL